MRFTWPEWAERLGAKIKRAQAAGDPDLGTTYDDHWLAALEWSVAEEGLLTTEALARRKSEGHAAGWATPHGKPIELPKK